MEFLRRNRVLLVASLLLVIVVALSACMPDATTRIISPDLGPQLVAEAEASKVEATPTGEAVAPKMLADLSEDEIYAGLEPDVVDAIKNGDLANAETLVMTNGCIGCHSLDPDAQMVGPTWHNVGDTAVTRIDGMSPAAYLYDSIIAPNDYVVEGFPGNVMPTTFGDTLSTQELGDLVAYLLSQHGQ